MASGSAGSRQSTTPREVQVIQTILKDMGVTDYEPAVVNQLLDFTYRELLFFCANANCQEHNFFMEFLAYVTTIMISLTLNTIVILI